MYDPKPLEVEVPKVSSKLYMTKKEIRKRLVAIALYEEEYPAKNWDSELVVNQNYWLSHAEMNTNAIVNVEVLFTKRHSVLIEKSV